MNRADRILVYKTQRCGYCNAAIRYLTEKKGFEVDVIDLTGDFQARADLVKASGQRTVPQIWVGQTHVGGFDDLRAMDMAGRLDPLLDAVTQAKN